MLPDNMELQEPQSKVWPLIPEDVYQTEITDIEYKVEPNRFKKEVSDPDEKQVMSFEFTIIEEGPHYGRKVWQKMAPIKPYPPSAANSSWIYRLATAMEGHAITREEADKYGSSNINGYIHKQVRVTIKHKPSKDGSKTYNNIEGFLTIKSELPLFDEKKVPTENQPTDKSKTGYEQLQNKYGKPAEPKPADDIQEIADQMEAAAQSSLAEVKIEDIPF